MVALFGKKKDNDSEELPKLGPGGALPMLPSNPMPPGAPLPPVPTMHTPPVPSDTQNQLPPAPTPFSMEESASPEEEKNHLTLMTEDIEKLVESSIEKKWDKVSDSMGKIEDWKKIVDEKLTDFQSRLEQLDKRLSDSQNAITGKVEDYNKSIKDVNVELKALSQVFEKILPTFTENVKILQDVVKKSKK